MSSSSRETILSEDFPLWMRRSLRDRNWGFLLALLFSITISWPFILQPGLPRSNASENYIYRTADYATAIRESSFFPRWSPHAVAGYGAPVPHYYPPGAPYAAAFIQILFTDDPVLAVRIVYIAALVTSGIASYTLVARRTNAAGGLLTSILYVYSPIIGLTGPHLLGDFPGTLAYALTPVFLWSVDRLMTGNPPFGLLTSAIAMFALYISHPLLGVLNTIIVIMYLIWNMRETENYRILSTIIALLLGIGLAAFYWLPALVEYRAVNWLQVSPQFSPTMSLNSLFAPAHQIDLGQIAPPPQLALGVWIIIASLATGVLLIIGRRLIRFEIFYFGTGIILIVIAVMILPGQIWLLGPITLYLAIASSVIVAVRKWWLPEAYRRVILPILLIGILITSAPVWLAPRWNANFGSATPQDQIRYEQLGYGIAVLPSTDRLPVTVSETVPPNRFLLDSYQSDAINRLPPNQLAGNIRADLLSIRSDNIRYQILVERPATIDFLTAHFPGWEAALAGQSLPLRPNEETGLIEIDLPSIGSSELEINLGSTPIRTTAWIISGVSLILLIVISYESMKRQGEYFEEYELLSIPEARLLGVVWCSFSLIVVLFATPFSPRSLRTAPGTTLTTVMPLQIRSNAGLSTVGYQLNQTDFQFGDVLRVDLYWRTLRQLGANYQIQIHLLNLTDNTRWAQTDFRHPGHYPTRRWPTDGYMLDQHEIRISRRIAPGRYQVAITLAECTRACDTRSPRLTFFATNGELLGQTLLLPIPITINP